MKSYLNRADFLAFILINWAILWLFVLKIGSLIYIHVLYVNFVFARAVLHMCFLLAIDSSVDAHPHCITRTSNRNLAILPAWHTSIIVIITNFTWIPNLWCLSLLYVPSNVFPPSPQHRHEAQDLELCVQAGLSHPSHAIVKRSNDGQTTTYPTPIPRYPWNPPRYKASPEGLHGTHISPNSLIAISSSPSL